ncbi:hypothetical protein ACFLXE_00685 [Chloroflexota bacterium]
MRAKQQTITREAETRLACCHYWLIEAGCGATSPGVCAFCGEKREFTNNLFICTDENGERIVDNNRPLHAKRNGRNGGKNGSQEKRPRYTIEDYRRWGKMGGRGHKKNKG